MYNHGNCKCPHHWVSKILALLVWVAGVLFFWTSWRGVAVWGFESLYYAWAAVVLSLMAFSSKVCGCCSRGKMDDGMEHHKMCSHEQGCKCGDCDRCR